MSAALMIEPAKNADGQTESVACEKCGKPIAAAMVGSALCCRCRYGQMHSDGNGRQEPDAFQLMRRYDARFLSRGQPEGVKCCHQCGLEPRWCMCWRRNEVLP